jgi:outer membrane protein TolC
VRTHWPTLVVLAYARSIFAQPLTAENLARKAESTSFDVAARRQEVAAAQAALEQARSAYLPRISGAARYVRLSDLAVPTIGNLVVAPTVGTGPIPPGAPLLNVPVSFPILLDQYTLSAGLQLPLSDYLLRIPQGVSGARAGADAAALGDHSTRLRVAADARVLYYTWLRARGQDEVVVQSLEQARGHLEDVRHLAEAGVASKADVLRVESQVAGAELLAVRTHNLVELVEQQIRTAMHDPVTTKYSVGETVDADVPAIDAGDLDALLQEAGRNRLELRALLESARALREQAKAARAVGWPRLDGFADGTYANPNPRILPQKDEFIGSWDVGIQLSWAPTDSWGTSAAAQAAEARASQIDAQRALAEDGIRIEVTQARQALQEATVGIGTTRRGLDAAQESYRVRRVLFQNGRATSVELTDAETELTRARLEALSARIDLRIARVRLDHALGRDVR